MTNYTFKDVFGVDLYSPLVTNLRVAIIVAKELVVKYRKSVYIYKSDDYIGCVEFPCWYNGISNLFPCDFSFYRY